LFQIRRDDHRLGGAVRAFELCGDFSQLRFHRGDEHDRVTVARELVRQMHADPAR
jgi:hypothetical protein